MKILVTGGSASGKSAVAEELCVKLGKQTAYIATMQPFGKDAAYRIDRHRKLRAGKQLRLDRQQLGKRQRQLRPGRLRKR